ncbi:hypothetical protein [Endozoicomonas sp. 8E]|uniref:hypothetical protein n=1 Tax=Endozoicomonas sp. 8E TaxID=3035692 RepID=UPI0029390ED2|nr:hypothetical protein [Endozoicomonas sp. 8E]WOG26949.1 hypothetical protein P6910_20725 [Endozoicomonas sp. 8E]
MTRRFIVELEQNADFSNLNFSIKHDCRTLSGSPSEIVYKHSYSEPSLPSDNKRHKPYSYGVKTTSIESITWQWLYTTNLLIACELTLITKSPPPRSISYSWPPVEAFITVSWLLKSYWNPDSPLFYPIEQKKATLNQPLAIITMMAGSEDISQQAPPSESSGQPFPRAITIPSGYFTQFPYSDSGDGNENPQQHPHTLGLNCFVYPCHGICRYGLSSTGRELRESPLNSLEHSAGHSGPVSYDVPDSGQLPLSTDDLVAINGLLNLHGLGLHKATGISCALPPVTPPTGTSETGQTSGSAQCGQSLPRLSPTGATDNSGQRACDPTLVGADDQQRACGKVCKDKTALISHKRSYHTGQKNCDETLVGEDGLQRSCGKVCKTAKALTEHKSKYHSGRKICEVKVVGEDGQQIPCGKIFVCAQYLYTHKSSIHARQKSCDLKVLGEDGQLRQCGNVCKNGLVLANHKRKAHSGQKTCDIFLVSEDGQQRPCGKTCKNSQILSNHKRKDHTGQQICSATVVGKDGQPQPCRKVCLNTKALSDHKSRYHSGQRTCDLLLIGEDGQQQLCGQACMNAQALSDHKKKHRKRKPVDVDQDNDLVLKKKK